MGFDCFSTACTIQQPESSIHVLAYYTFATFLKIHNADI